MNSYDIEIGGYRVQPDDPEWSKHEALVNYVMRIVNLALFCLPLATNVYASVILFNVRFLKDFSIFGIQLGLLTIAEIVFGISFQVQAVLHLAIPMPYLTPYYVVAHIIQWTTSAVTNWTVAFLCVSQCVGGTDTSKSRGSNKLCYSVFIVVTAAISLIMSLCLSFQAYRSFMRLYWSFRVCVELLPALVMLIGGVVLCYKIRKNDSSATTQNKVALILAAVFSLSNLVSCGFSLILMATHIPALSPFLAVIHSVAFFLECFSLIFVFCSASTLFRTEALAILKCKPGAQNNEVPMTDI